MLLVDEVLDWLKADDADCEQVEALLAAATAHVESETGMIYRTTGEVVQSIGGAWPLSLQGEPEDPDYLVLERWNGSVWEVVSPSVYYVDGAFLRLAGSAPDFGASPRYRVTYETGYPDGQQPAPVQLAVKMLVQMWYDGMDDEDARKAVRNLLAPYKRVVV